jgi:AcrR family transcriptional regulator
MVPSDGDGDAAPQAPAGATVGRQPLDRQRILDAAVDFIDEHGLRQLSMRRLGARLGVEAMSLYRYVPGRDDLLDGIADTVIDRVYSDPEVLLEPSNGWQDYLQRLASGVRRAALAHPGVFPVVATRPPEAPWLRPPLRSARWVDSFLAGLLDQGFDDAGAVKVYRAFTSFLLGHLLLEVSALGAETGPVEQVDPHARPTSDLGEYPQLRRLRPALTRNRSGVEFEESLESLIERLSTLRPLRG